MHFPDSWTERLPFLEPLEDDWGPVPRPALIAWLVFYVLFLYQAMRGSGVMLMIDLVFISSLSFAYASAPCGSVLTT